MVCLKSRKKGVPAVTKNCVLLVLGPALAMASCCVPVNANCWTNWSANGVPGCPLLPVPSTLGAPPWATKSVRFGKPLTQLRGNGNIGDRCDRRGQELPLFQEFRKRRNRKTT